MTDSSLVRKLISNPLDKGYFKKHPRQRSIVHAGWHAVALMLTGSEGDGRQFVHHAGDAVTGRGGGGD
jgi:hypothetical protein